jgi:hypothetical protein
VSFDECTAYKITSLAQNHPTQTGVPRTDVSNDNETSRQHVTADRRIATVTEGVVTSSKSSTGSRKLETDGRSKFEGRPVMTNTSSGEGRTRSSDDKLTYIDNFLHWDVGSLVLFIDRRGEARVPTRFFRAVCQRDRHGSPGPMYRSLLQVGVQLAAVGVYLVFVTMIVVRLLGVAYAATSSGQAIATLVAGSPPLLVYLIGSHLRRRRDAGRRSSLNDTIREEMDAYRQSWPVYDLPFQMHSKATTAAVRDGCGSNDDVRDNADVTSVTNDSTANCGTISTAVDLLITIRDDSELSNDDGGTAAARSRRRLGDTATHSERCSPFSAVTPDQPQSSRTSTL